MRILGGVYDIWTVKEWEKLFVLSHDRTFGWEIWYMNWKRSLPLFQELNPDGGWSDRFKK